MPLANPRYISGRVKVVAQEAAAIACHDDHTVHYHCDAKVTQSDFCKQGDDVQRRRASGCA